MAKTTGPSAAAAAGEGTTAAVVAIKLDKTVIIVSAVVGSLGLLSAILGFAAEGTNSNSIYCSTQTSAVGLGICAAIFLVIVQVTVSAVGGCCGCCKSRAIPSETKRIIGVVCAVVSWVLAAIAFILFLAGAIVASDCDRVKGGVFAGAGVLALFATALGITSYIVLRTQPQPDGRAAAAAAPDNDEPTPIGIPMVPGQFPPASPNPLIPEQSPSYAPYSPAPAHVNAGQAPNLLLAPPPQVGGYGQAPNPQFAPPVAPPPQAGGYGQAPNPPVAPPPPQGGAYGQQAPSSHFPAPPAHAQG